MKEKVCKPEQSSASMFPTTASTENRRHWSLCRVTLSVLMENGWIDVTALPTLLVLGDLFVEAFKKSPVQRHILHFVL